MVKLLWANRLTNAEKRGKFLSSDIDDADDWTKCAVGEWKGTFQSLTDGSSAPKGAKLYDLGINFAAAVERNDVPWARSEFNLIQSYMSNNIKRRGNPLSHSVVWKDKVAV